MTTSRTVCPNCKRVLRNVNTWHYCKEVEIDTLFIDKSDEIVLAFDQILQVVADWENVELSATKNCVVFIRNKTFLVIKPMKKWLEVKFYSNEMIDDEDLHKCELWSSKYQGILRLENKEQIKTNYFHYFKSSYLIS